MMMRVVTLTGIDPARLLLLTRMVSIFVIFIHGALALTMSATTGVTATMASRLS